MSVSDNIDMLTPGSVWLRRDGRQAKFLFLTNESLNAATQLKHPPQVIYADAEGNIFNRGIDDFFKIYTFLNVDGDLEKRLESLIVFNSTDYAHVEDPEDEPEAEAAAEPAALPVAEPEETLAESILREMTGDKVEASVGVTMQSEFELSALDGRTNPALTAEDLAKSLVVYSTRPNKDFTITEHHLTFKIGRRVNMETLREVFHPSETINTVDLFTVRTKYSEHTVVWDSWISLHPEYTVNGLYAVVIVGTSDAPIDSQETPGVDATEVAYKKPEGVHVPDMSNMDELLNTTTVTGSPLAESVAAPAPIEPAPIPAEVFVPQVQVVEPVVVPVAPVVVPAPAQPVVAPVQPVVPQVVHVHHHDPAPVVPQTVGVVVAPVPQVAPAVVQHAPVVTVQQ